MSRATKTSRTSPRTRGVKISNPVSAFLLGGPSYNWEPSVPQWALQPVLSELLKRFRSKDHENLSGIIAKAAHDWAMTYMEVTKTLSQKGRRDLLLSEPDRAEVFRHLVPDYLSKKVRTAIRRRKHCRLGIQHQANRVTACLEPLFDHPKGYPTQHEISFLRKRLPQLLADLKELHLCGAGCAKRYSMMDDESLRHLARNRSKGALRDAILGYCHHLSKASVRQHYLYTSK